MSEIPELPLKERTKIWKAPEIVLSCIKYEDDYYVSFDSIIDTLLSFEESLSEIDIKQKHLVTLRLGIQHIKNTFKEEKKND